MAKPLTIDYQGQSIDFTLEKVDRSKLYGYVETEVVDESGSKCELATLAGDGHTIVGKGGTALAYLSQDGRWLKKSQLKPVDVSGKTITPVKSTFDSPVSLDHVVTIDEYLSHNIHLTYRLTSEETHEDLLADLKEGKIFHFPFSYRGGLEASAGFLLQAADGNVFLCVGTPTAIEFVGLKAAAGTVQEDATTAVEEDDALDFSLV